MKLYGIPNCNTVKKARDWLTQHDIAVEFCNFKKDGVNETAAKGWLKQAGWESIINRKGLTWRGLDDQTEHLRQLLRSRTDAGKIQRHQTAYPREKWQTASCRIRRICLFKNF